MRRVCLWLFAGFLGLTASGGVLRATPDHGLVILVFMITSLLVATIVTVSVVTTTEVLFPQLRPRKHRRSNVASA